MVGIAARDLIAGGNWRRANEIVIRHLTRRTATRYRCRDRAVHSLFVLAFANLAAHSSDGSIHFVCMDWRHMGEMLEAGAANYSEGFVMLAAAFWMYVGAVAEGMRKISYAGYRFPPEAIHQAIWLYLRFTLSFREFEDLLAERGIAVSYETVRRWVNHFGPVIAAHLRKRRPNRMRPGILTKSI